jgi:arylsulfatase A-like enzyme
MRAVMVMYDSLNRRMLEPYGCDWVRTPNFARLANHAVTFDRMYVGSMPCMPARREIQTGRYNFLHRSWGPMEPFDDSMPFNLRQNGVYTHLTSDHYHYWEEGGSTYHTKYQTWQCERGHEGDPWMGQVADPDVPDNVMGWKKDHPFFRQDFINREFMPTVEQHPQHKTFGNGIDFIRHNADQDNWLLHIETFDPHEPYFTHQQYKDLYPHAYTGKHFDWPGYGRLDLSDDEAEHVRFESAANHSMCDDYLGRVLDVFDELNLWEDTMLIVHTDHGFLLGEHDWWAKCAMPFYNEVANAPFFVWDPRSRKSGERRQSLVQTIDIAPTLYEYFGVDIPEDVEGVGLRDAVASDSLVREAGLFGIHGGQVNCTDGRHLYMRAAASPENTPLYNYTVMPTHMRVPFSMEEMRTATLHEGFGFTKGSPVLRIEGGRGAKIDPDHERNRTMLFDLENDPGQEHPIDDADVEKKMTEHMVGLMKANDAPPEQWERLGL